MNLIIKSLVCCGQYSILVIIQWHYSFLQYQKGKHVLRRSIEFPSLYDIFTEHSLILQI